MPAYKQRLFDHECQEPGCDRKATFRVFNSFNGLVGRFCGPHANKKIDEMNAPRGLGRKTN